MFGRNEPDIDPVRAAIALALVMGVLVLAFLAVEWPVFVWSLVHGRPMLLSPVDAIAAGLQYLFSRDHSDYPELLWPVAELLPPPAAWVTLNVTGAVMVVVAFLGVLLRVDLWSGRSTLGLSGWDPRRKVKPRSWAKPRDWLHLQPVWSRSGPIRRPVSRVMRLAAGERRHPAAVGGDSWNLGRLRGAEVRSGPEMHELVVAPTRAGKTRRVIATEAIEHDGPAVILSNKLDVLTITRAARERRGPVWVYAPLSKQAGECVGWTPLRGCEDREWAMMMGQWILDADPSAGSASEHSDGARFYIREAVEVLLPALLHAAAISEYRMGDVQDWLRGGVDALDRPRELLSDQASDPQAQASAAVISGIQAQEGKQRGFVLSTAAQLVGAYRFSAVQAADRAEFDPAELLKRDGTLFLIAPESQTDLLAPIFGGILGEILRACELRSHNVSDTRRLTPLKILADEAAHLAPLGKLPTYLSVSASWAVRWCVIYQTLAQVRHRYRDEADAVLANTLCKLVLGPVHDRSTRDEIVALLGHELVEHSSRTSDRSGATRSKTRQTERRPVLSAEKLALLGEGEAIAIHGRELPAVVRLPFYNQWRAPRW